MALKEDINDIKQSLSAEEEFLENVIKSEFFIKKHKKLIISIIVILVVICGGIYTSKFVQEKSVKEANLVYLQLQNDPNNSEILEKLRSKNISLATIFEFRMAMDKNDTKTMSALSNQAGIDPLLKDIISFEAGEENSELMGSYAIVLRGYELLKENKIKEANNEFNKIPANSKFTNIINHLRHFNGENK